jgi:hypothetical protein
MRITHEIEGSIQSDAMDLELSYDTNDNDICITIKDDEKNIEVDIYVNLNQLIRAINSLSIMRG